VSAFGGIVAVNRPLDAADGRGDRKIFTEVVIAPGATTRRKAIFAAKKNLRLLLTGGLPDPARGGLTVKLVAGGLLVQDRDNGRVTPPLKVVTKRAPTEAGTGRPAVRLDRRQAREVERHRLCQGRRHRRASARGR
jgi:phosphoribosylaminoimidazolecarboxamide formyltransferase/IMP cyclohydrolase